MRYPVTLFSFNAMICSFCGWNFYVAGGEVTGYHPTYEDLRAGWPEGVPFNENPSTIALQTCPNAGKTFRLPLCPMCEDE